MTVSIHQPNFMPWYPFFQKVMMADVFVILQNCQYEKNGYQNRFNISNVWHTMSVGKGIDSIVNKRYLKPNEDWIKIKQSLKGYCHLLSMFDEYISDVLSITNSSIIIKICELLDIKTKVVFDYPTELKSTERLVDICLKHGATEYVSGIGGKTYLDVSLFKQNNINVVFQREEDMIKVPILQYMEQKNVV